MAEAKIKVVSPTPHVAFDKNALDVAWIPVGKLLIKWPKAQREEIKMSKVKKIAGAFDPDKFNFLKVTLPDERGYYHVIDGMHRKTALELLWGPETLAPCHIAPTKDPQRAAELFLGDNRDRNVVTPVSIFIASVEAGNEDCVAIDKVVRKLGFRITAAYIKNGISSVGGLKTVYGNYGPQVLHDTLQVLQASWGTGPEAVQKTLLIAYGRLIGEHFDKINYGRLVEVSKKRYQDTSRLLGLSKTIKELSGISATEALYRTLMETYNRGLKQSGQLKD